MTADMSSVNGPQDRILWNAGRVDVDEIVCHNVTVHIEQLSDTGYYIGIWREVGNEPYLQGDFVGKDVSFHVWDPDDWPWHEVDEHKGAP